MSTEDAKQWESAMQKEYDSIIKNDTCTRTGIEPSRKPIYVESTPRGSKEPDVEGEIAARAVGASLVRVGKPVGPALRGVHRQRAATAARRRAPPSAQAAVGGEEGCPLPLALREPPHLPPGQCVPRGAVLALRSDDARWPRRAGDNHLRRVPRRPLSPAGRGDDAEFARHAL